MNVVKKYINYTTRNTIKDNSPILVSQPFFLHITAINRFCMSFSLDITAINRFCDLHFSMPIQNLCRYMCVCATFIFFLIQMGIYLMHCSVEFYKGAHVSLRFFSYHHIQICLIIFNVYIIYLCIGMPQFNQFSFDGHLSFSQ